MSNIDGLVTMRQRGLTHHALDAGDAQRSCARGGRHLHPICLANRAFGAVQVCSPEAHSPDLPPRFAQAFFYASAFFRSDGGNPVRPNASNAHRWADEVQVNDMFTRAKQNTNEVYLLFVIVLVFIVANVMKPPSNDSYLWASPVTSHKATVPELWSLSDIYIDDNWHQPLISANNNKLIVLGSNNNTQAESVLAFDGTSGQPIWSVDYRGITITTTESKVIVGGASRVIALDIQNGSTLWGASVLSNVVDIIPKDDRLYIYGVSVRKYILDVSNGSVLEIFEEPYSIEEEPSIGDIAYTFDGNNNIIATDKPNNQVLWRNQANAVSNLAVTPTFIYALGDDGSLLRFDTQTGQKESWLLFAPTSFVARSEQTTSFAYYVAIDISTNILFVYLGDGAQLFAFQMPIV